MAMRTLAFEIGTEELPAFDLHAATLKLEGIVRSAFDAEGIPVGGIEVYSTPRRLAVVVEGVPERTEKIEEVFRGPAAKIAFDADGNPTKAARLASRAARASTRPRSSVATRTEWNTSTP